MLFSQKCFILVLSAYGGVFMSKILVVDDEENIRQLIVKYARLRDMTFMRLKTAWKRSAFAVKTTMT